MGGDPLLEPPEGAQPSRHLEFRLPPPEVKEKTFLPFEAPHWHHFVTAAQGIPTLNPKLPYPGGWEDGRAGPGRPGGGKGMWRGGCEHPAGPWAQTAPTEPGLSGPTAVTGFECGAGSSCSWWQEGMWKGRWRLPPALAPPGILLPKPCEPVQWGGSESRDP